MGGLRRKRKRVPRKGKKGKIVSFVRGDVSDAG
jgi:hypothetical protein